VTHAQERTFTLPGTPASPGTAWQPRLLLHEQTLGKADRKRPVLYVHGGTFGIANALLFRFGGVSWADALNEAGFSAWGVDFAGYGGSESYPDMANPAPAPGEPLGRAPAAARQIERAVRAILQETGASRVSIIAHSWGTMAAGKFAGEHPELVDRIVFFAPIVRRDILKEVPALGPWQFLTVEQQHKRFVEDVPKDHAPVLDEADFPAWASLYLSTDPTSSLRSPPSVKTPNGPVADIMAAWSGALAYDPARIRSPVAIIRGEWDSLSRDADAAWLLSMLTSAPVKTDTRIDEASHLMHLESGRTRLYRASTDFLNAR